MTQAINHSNSSRNRILRIVFLVVAALGLIDSLYLVLTDLSGGLPLCGTDGCDFVLTSQYAQVLGVPTAAIGAVFYLTVLILGGWYFRSRRPAVAGALVVLVSGGLMASVYFVYLQLAVLYAICVYCMVSASTSTVLFVLAWTFYLTRRRVSGVALPIENSGTDQTAS